MKSIPPARPAPAPGAPAGEVARWIERSDVFQFLAHVLDDAFLLLDADERVVYAGGGAGALFGRADYALYGCPLRSVLTGEGSVPTRLTGGGTWEAQLESGRWVSLEARSMDGATIEGLGSLDGHVLLLVREIGEDLAIRDRLDLFRRALDVAHDLVVVVDATQDDYPITFVNQRFLEVTGYERGEVIGRNCRFLQVRPDGTHDDDQPGLRQLRTSVATGESVYVLLRNYTKGGWMFWNDLFVMPVRDRAGRLTHFVGVQNDVTDRIGAESERDTQELMLGAFYNRAPFLMGIIEVGADGALTYKDANRALAAYHRMRPAQVVGRRLDSFDYSEENLALFRDSVRACLDSGRPQLARGMWPPRHGSSLSLHFKSRLTPVSDREVAFVVEDATEYDQLVEAQAERTAALEQAADAVVITDGGLDKPGPNIHYVNRAFEEMTGWSRDEVIGRTPRIMQGAMTDRGELDRMRRRLSAGRPYRGEIVNERKDGTPYVVEVDIAPLRGPDGEVTGFVSTQRDVTDRRRLESEVLSAAAQAQEEIARDLHDGVGQTLSGTAYHLHGLAERLAAEGSAYAAEAERAAQLVQDAQRQARTLAHGLSPVAVGADGLAPALARLAQKASESYDIECAFVCAAPPIVEPSDRAGDLYRIAQEAVANAVRHGQPTSVVIRLEPPHTSAAGSSGDGQPYAADERALGDGLALLSVEDDGVGISVDALDEAGGLGLRTMRYRARRVGGSIDVFRRERGGTAVHVRFPVAADVTLSDRSRTA